MPLCQSLHWPLRCWSFARPSKVGTGAYPQEPIILGSLIDIRALSTSVLVPSQHKSNSDSTYREYGPTSTAVSQLDRDGARDHQPVRSTCMRQHVRDISGKSSLLPDAQEAALGWQETPLDAEHRADPECQIIQSVSSQNCALFKTHKTRKVQPPGLDCELKDFPSDEITTPQSLATGKTSTRWPFEQRKSSLQSVRHRPAAHAFDAAFPTPCQHSPLPVRPFSSLFGKQGTSSKPKLERHVQTLDSAFSARTISQSSQHRATDKFPTSATKADGHTDIPARRYSLEEDRKILDMQRLGHGWRETAQVLGRTVGSVFNRSQILRGRSTSPPALSEKLGRGKSYTAHEDFELMELHGKGYKAMEIAKNMPQRSPGSVRTRLGLLLSEARRRERAGDQNGAYVDNKRQCVRWSTEEIKRLRQLRANGIWGKQLHEAFPHRSFLGIIHMYTRIRKSEEIQLVPIRKVWTPGEDELLRKLLSQGLTYRQVADALGNRSAVSVRCRRHRLIQ